MANTALNRTTQLLLTNKSGGSVAQGDVVVVDTANASSFTTTTTSGYVSGTPGVVLEPGGIANNATGMVAICGYVPVINLSGTGSIGDLVKCHTVAKQGVRHGAPSVTGDFAQVFGTTATPTAILWGNVNFEGSGSIGGATGSTDNALIRADGTGGATVQNSLATIDDSGSVNIPTGQTYKINGVAHTHAGSGASITEGVYASAPGSPTDNDVYLATDSHVMLHRASSAWVPFGPINKLTFPPAISGNWTWANQGTSTADDSLGVIQMVSQTNGGQTLRALYKAAPVSTPYTITALVSLDIGYNVNYLGCGIGFRENSSGKYIVFGPESADGACCVGAMKWNSTSGYTTSLFSDGGNSGGSGHWMKPMWLRIKDDGTNLTFWYSNSGILWTQRATTARNSFFSSAPDGVAMCLYQENGSIQSQAVFWSWAVT